MVAEVSETAKDAKTLNSLCVAGMQTFGFRNASSGQDDKKQSMMELKYLTGNLFDAGKS